MKKYLTEELLDRFALEALPVLDRPAEEGFDKRPWVVGWVEGLPEGVQVFMTEEEIRRRCAQLQEKS